MTSDDTVLVIRPDGTASLVGWPTSDDGRRAVISEQVGAASIMRRCGKGVLGFALDESAADEPVPLAPNAFAMAAYAEQGVELGVALRGAVLFARNPSKGSVVKPLTAAQATNLLAVTGARLD